MRSLVRFLTRLRAELRFAWWDAYIRGALAGDRFDAWIVRTCPDAPDFRGHDITLSLAPSVVASFLLRYYIPLQIGLETWSLHAVGIALVAGRIACSVAERLGVRRLDAVYGRWWSRRSLEPRPLVARVIASGERVSGFARRWSLAALAGGGMLVGVAIAVRAATGTPTASAPIGVCALALVTAAMVLAVVIVLGGIVELFAPFVLGPPSASAHVVSREELGALRPLFETWPAKLASDAWDLVRVLRP
jgi:hypothetical protein